MFTARYGLSLYIHPKLIFACEVLNTAKKKTCKEVYVYQNLPLNYAIYGN